MPTVTSFEDLAEIAISECLSYDHGAEACHEVRQGLKHVQHRSQLREEEAYLSNSGWLVEQSTELRLQRMSEFAGTFWHMGQNSREDLEEVLGCYLLLGLRRRQSISLMQRLERLSQATVVAALRYGRSRSAFCTESMLSSARRRM